MVFVMKITFISIKPKVPLFSSNAFNNLRWLIRTRAHVKISGNFISARHLCDKNS